MTQSMPLIFALPFMTDLSRKPITLIGAPGSPYTHKMLAILRYRRIPYEVIWGQPYNELERLGITKPKVELFPTLVFPEKGGQANAMVDSTPIIRHLESRAKHRSIIPNDPAVAFIDYLIEDFADEWCTKYMFHYRWHGDRDADNASTLLPLAMNPCMPAAQYSKLKKVFSERQISRLHVVGSSDLTTPIIDASYRRFLGALEAHLCTTPFILGLRPSACDFALYGQLSQLTSFDPTPRGIAEKLAPRVVAWVQRVSDLSGVLSSSDDWSLSDSLPITLTALLSEIGRGYTPALLANAQAFQNGEPLWETTIDGRTWSQQTFPYQAKCLRWINEEFRALNDEDKTRVMGLVSETGCEALLL